MTGNEPLATDGDRAESPPLARVALAIASGLALLFSIGVVAGVIAAAIERGALKPTGALALAGAAMIAIGAWVVLRRVIPALLPTQSSPRVGKARRMVMLSGAVGGVLGMFLALVALSSGQSSSDVMAGLSSSPLPRWVALVAIAVWVGAVPWLTINWHRNIDEHEAQAYRDGALAGIYAYFAIAPTWWMAWRGGMAAEPQEMPVFLVVVGIVGLVWAWRRYR
ncbi:MAG TPA: hypothetical protein VM055_02840 [Novosphingobium sp.]|nr:hypothetical protein [Novosphingobium sp.]